MTELVSTFQNVSLRGSDYTLFLTNERQDDTDLQKRLDRHFFDFGDQAGLPVRAVRARRVASAETFAEVREKEWPAPVRHLLTTTEHPFLIVVKNDFAAFDPRADDWRILWFTGARSPRNSIPALFNALQASLNRQEDILAFFDRIAADNPRTIYGDISSPARPQVHVNKRRAGRPGIMDPEFEVQEWVMEGLANGQMGDFSRGWQGRLVDALLAAKPGIREHFPRKKSVTDALRRAGIFQSIREHHRQG
ncbi:MAG TPA: hypothetical protein DC046_12155 [Rhodospirillaceae bacterium]|nr:hypothetical protein [Rhodospirillaceae bacterium]